MKKIRVIPKDTYSIGEDRPCKVTRSGNVTELMTVERKNVQNVIKVLDKDTYLDIRTGEVKERQKHDSRAENVARLKRSMAEFRNVVNANTTEPEKVRFITLTYAMTDGQPMTDWDRLYEDFKYFWKKLQKRFPTVERYQYAVEAQRSGNLHIHAIVEFMWEAPYIDNNAVLEPLWGHGFTSVKAVDNCDNVGAYLSAYVTNDPECADGHGAEKGKRLTYVPVGKRIYRWSRNSFKPVVTNTTYGKAVASVNGERFTLATAFDLIDDNGKVVNTVSKVYYNRKDE